MRDVQGHMQEVLRAVVSGSEERGVQLAVYVDGALVVDAWAGLADVKTGRRVDRNTLFPVFSVGKGMTATLVHQLVERGKLSYDAPVAEVWPEFGANGKGGITVRHVLSHTAGLPFMPAGVGLDELGNWDVMCAAIAQLKPAWPAGTLMAYHAVTFSWLVGEVARRVDGRPFEQMLHDDICAPLGLSSMFIGLPDNEQGRVAVLEEIRDPAKTAPSRDELAPSGVPGWMQVGLMNMPEGQRLCLPSSTGIMNARDIARHYAALIPGGVDGVELLPADRVRQATQMQLPTGLPPGELPPIQMSLGYFVGPGNDFGPGASAFGHGGYGGSIGFADPENRLAVGLTKNLFSPRAAQTRILREVRDALGIAQ